MWFDMKTYAYGKDVFLTRFSKKLSLWYTICYIACMKHFYLVCLLAFYSLSYGQDKPSTGDIDGFKVYPNPVANGKVYIQTAQNAPKKILIYDVFGTKVKETTILGNELNLSDLVAGVYVLRVFEKDKVATRKLIVK